MPSGLPMWPPVFSCAPARRPAGGCALDLGGTDPSDARGGPAGAPAFAVPPAPLPRAYTETAWSRVTSATA